jgi:hypothetical protein
MTLAHRLLVLPALALSATAGAEDQVPALAGLDRLRERFGPAPLARVFEMTAVDGDPQPASWRVTAHDPARTSLLHEYWIGHRRVTDEGLNDDYYPNHLPKAFFKSNRVKLDSTQAFAIVEQVARDAGCGFDSVNYKLHAREYSNEPVWTLTLLDSDEEIVGSVHLSADTGDLLRTVWIRRTRSGRLIVYDSALDDDSRALAALNARRQDQQAAATEPQPPPPSPEPGSPTPPPDERTPAPDDPAADEEVPEIKRLDEVQEKADQPPPKDP